MRGLCQAVIDVAHVVVSESNNYNGFIVLKRVYNSQKRGRTRLRMKGAGGSPGDNAALLHQTPSVKSNIYSLEEPEVAVAVQ
jgi:hypothetical protein